MMTTTTLGVVLGALALLGLGTLLCVLRGVIGPSGFDRVLAFDCAVLHILGGVLLISIWEDSAVYMDVVLVVAILGFLGTISFAAFLEESHFD